MSTQAIPETKALPDPDVMAEHADAAAQILQALANPNRLMILCTLVEGEASVSAINQRVPLSQSALSQHLARLRQEGLVATRRDGQTIFYRIDDDDVLSLMGKLYELYCAPDQ